MRDKTMCIVLLPATDCAFNLANISIGELTGILNLKSREDITISRQSSDAVWLRCSSHVVKRHILSWDTRSHAKNLFAIRVKEDLWKHERIQKARMWPIMQTLYAAGLRPTWSRASVTWKTHEGRFFIHPGELPQSLPAVDIVTYAKSGCTIEPHTPPQPQVITQHAHSSCQTEAIPKSIDVPNQHLVTTLQQDLALAKRRIAAQAIQCCFWRQKYKGLEAKTGPPRLTKTASSQTITSPLNAEAHTQTASPTSGVALKAHVSVQTDTPSQHSDDATALTVQAIQQQAQQMVTNLQTQITALQTLADKKVAEAQAREHQFMGGIKTLQAKLARLEKRHGKR